MQVLKEIDEICQKEGLDYFVMYGTLIGAVRHKGFIPWDDDIDIMMPRESYNKLIAYYNEHSTRFDLLNYDNCKDYPYMISRVSDGRYYLDVENEKDYGLGAFVDIYPLDFISHNYYYSCLKGKIFGLLSSLYFSSTRINAPKFTKDIKSSIKLGTFFLSRMIGSKNIARLLRRVDLTSNFGQKGYYGCLQWMTADSTRNVIDIEKIKGRVRVEFEGILVNAPSNAHQLLTEYYGDYMTLPPEDERVPHHMYTAYKK